MRCSRLSEDIFEVTHGLFLVGLNSKRRLERTKRFPERNVELSNYFTVAVKNFVLDFVTTSQQNIRYM
jgi:hypothetical protein